MLPENFWTDDWDGTNMTQEEKEDLVMYMYISSNHDLEKELDDLMEDIQRWAEGTRTK